MPKHVHDEIKNKLKVPLSGSSRSLNVAMTVAIVASEALKQNKYFKMNNIEIKKKIVSNWFNFLQLQIYKQFKILEENTAKKKR